MKSSPEDYDYAFIKKRIEELQKERQGADIPPPPEPKKEPDTSQFDGHDYGCGGTSTTPMTNASHAMAQANNREHPVGFWDEVECQHCYSKFFLAIYTDCPFCGMAFNG